MDVLEGLRVLDLSSGMSGALVTQLLADYGAEVIRVEPPAGDPLREQPAFYFWQRGKKSVVLDLGEKAGREDAQRLAVRSDILVQTFRPNVAERLGLGYEELAAENPALLYASITGFGRRGPYAGLKGYEGLVMAKLGGMPDAHLAPRAGPAFPCAPFSSFSAAQTALQGILAALYVRERTGRGQRIDTSLVQGVVAHDPWDWFLKLVAERYPKAFHTAPPASERGVPNQSFAFRLLVCLTRDGHWLQFSQTSPHLFRAFMETLELDWMWDDPEWSSAPEFDTEEKRERFWEHMLEAAHGKSLGEWQRIFEAHPNVWAEVYRTTREVLEHPQMRHNGHVTLIDDPRVGRTTQLAPMVRLSETPGVVRAPAPDVGQHTREVLLALDAAHPRPRRRPGTRPLPRRPLEGITVLELGLFYAAPYGTALLADLGARVIKIEPMTGEPMRHIMPFPDAGAVKSLQGKESVAVDVGQPEGREVVHRIARRADLVLMSYRAGVAEKHGVDAATLRKLNPDLIYLNAPGYGIDGPCGRKPAFAPTMGAGAGMGRLQAGPSIPHGVDLPLDEIKRASLRLWMAAQTPGNADGFASLGVATALLLGLVARERTGVAQELLTSMLCTTAYALSEDCIDYAGRADRPLPDAMLYGLSALYRLYETQSGWVFLAAPQEREWRDLCRALEPWKDLGSDERFGSAALRRRNDGALAEELAAVLRRRTAADWERELTRADVGCVELARGPIPRAAMDDPICADAGFLTEVEHPSFGRHRRLAPLAELSLTPGEAKPACLFGQHTESVLLELGYDAEAVARFESDGVIVRANSN